FKSLRPQANLDAALYPKTVNTSVPAGTQVRMSSPSENIFPSYARNTLNKMIGTIIGHPVNLQPKLVEFPEIDSLIRFQLGLNTQNMSRELQDKLGNAASWCLPYLFYL
ncbi:MAG: hypothetical protein WAO98_05300, partial [Alphaproteobacteria bacterium]